MAGVPITPEVSDFIANLLRATRAGTIGWESVSAKQLVAPLSGEYRVALREVADFDGQVDESDHTLSLLVGNKELFALDRRDVGAEELQNALGEPIEYSYKVFSELWRRALMRAMHLNEHLTNVNRLLGEQVHNKRE